MGERNTAVGVQARPGDPSRYTLRFDPDRAQPTASSTEDRVVFHLSLEQDGEARARVDIPLTAAVVAGHDAVQLRLVVGTLAARQLGRLAARGRLLVDSPLMPLRLVGLDPHVMRLLHQPQLPMDSEGAWVVLV
jgi:hypothetical protein